MKTPKPTYKDLESKIERQNEAINNFSKKLLERDNEAVRLRESEDDKDYQLSKRVHGLTALTFAVLAFAVGIVVGGNIRSQSQDNARTESEMESALTAIEFALTNNGRTNLVLNQKCTNRSGGILIVNVPADWTSFTNRIACPIKKTYLSPYVRKGAELLRQPR